MKITKATVASLIEHAQKDSPVEACGYLAGANGVITTAYRLKNADGSPEHFSFLPAEQFATVRQIRAAGLRLAAVYHSHPASPARPSAEDIRLANDPSISYAIVSLLGDAPDIKAFFIRQGQVTPDPVEIIEG